MSYRRGDTGYSREAGYKEVKPKYSRIFVLGDSNKLDCDESIKKIFGDFGEIESIFCKKNRDTGKSKGVVFIKYRKASQAAKAIEALQGADLGDETLKVTLAADRDKEHIQLNPTRLFLMIPRTMERDDLKEEFRQFGDVEHASIVKDRETGASKGLGYVNFYKFTDAAIAFEECDEKWRPQWAESKEEMDKKRKGDRDDYGRGYSKGYDNNYGGSSYGSGSGSYREAKSESIMGMVGGPTHGPCRLKVLFDPQVNRDSFMKLFNIVPGLVNCELGGMTPDGAISYVEYNNPQSAAHAMERINGFEFGQGFPLRIVFDGAVSSGMESSGQAMPGNIAALMENIKQATEVIKASGYGNMVNGGSGMRGASMADSNAQSVCSAKLPARKELLPANTKCEERLFFVLKDAHETPNPEIIKDVFCRFGNLIDAFCLRGRKCGYARYATKQSAHSCIKTLNGEDLLGSRLAVEIAEDASDRKRPRRE